MSGNICVIGMDNGGLVTAAGLAELGNRVIGVDKNGRKIRMLKSGKVPFFEPEAEELLGRNLDESRLSFTCDIDGAVSRSDVVFIAVGTPEGFDGHPNMNYVTEAVHSIAENLTTRKTIVLRSTVPVGTGRRIEKYLRSRFPEGDFDVVSNPGFQREGSAVNDFLSPDRTVIGADSERARYVMNQVYRAFDVRSVPFLWCSLETAELIKYSSSAFAATKITFINQLSSLASETGAHMGQIIQALGMGSFRPGPGFGGVSLPGDLKALVETGVQNGVDLSLIREVLEANDRQKKMVVARLLEIVGDFEGVIVAVLGLAYKENSDQVGDSPAITIVNELIFQGAEIRAHDPEAMDNFKSHFPYVTYCEKPEDAAEGADILIIVTAWNVYEKLNLMRLKSRMKGDLIYDTRNILDTEKVLEAGFRYLGTGCLLLSPYAVEQEGEYAER